MRYIIVTLQSGYKDFTFICSTKLKKIPTNEVFLNKKI